MFIDHDGIIWLMAKDDAAGGQTPALSMPSDADFEDNPPEEAEDTAPDDTQTSPDTQAERVDEGVPAAAADEPVAPEDDAPDEVVFDEAIVRHAEFYGFDAKRAYGSPEEAITKLAQLDKMILDSAKRPDSPSQQPATPQTPTHQPPPQRPQATDFKLEFGDDFDPEVRAAIERVNDHWSQRFDALSSQWQQAQAQQAEAQMTTACRLRDRWLAEQKYDLTPQERDAFLQESVVLADAFMRRGGQLATLDENEVFRRVFNLKFPEKAAARARASVEEKSNKRRSQATTPPNAKAPRTGGKPTRWQDMPPGEERQNAYYEEKARELGLPV